MRIPNHVRIAVGQFPVKAELIDGSCFWRGVKDFEHSTLCRVFNLDPVRFYFDLPSSIRGTGSSSSGYGGNRSARIINGYIMMQGREEPWGKLTIIRESDKIRDVDPTDMREFYRLDR